MAEGEVDAVLARQLAVLEAHDRAMAAYRPSGRVAADLVLLEATESDGGADGDTGSDAVPWAGHAAGALRRRAVPGNHLTMVRGSNAPALAEALADAMAAPADAGG